MGEFGVMRSSRVLVLRQVAPLCSARQAHALKQFNKLKKSRKMESTGKPKWNSIFCSALFFVKYYWIKSFLNKSYQKIRLVFYMFLLSIVMVFNYSMVFLTRASVGMVIEAKGACGQKSLRSFLLFALPESLTIPISCQDPFTA